ncbi:MAG: adenosylcobinamide-GDP ribazoletransferase [bacterium]|nr:adenosylcobinamide-GDP ribazoletransferase [bacterium]
MNRFWAGVRFLTVFPVPFNWGTREGDLAGSAVFFPVIGGLIGTFAGLLVWALGLWTGDLLTGVLTTVFLISVSGGLHMDGLSDTADGFFSARSEQRMLEIMRDPHIGAMGVMAIVSIFCIKAVAIAGAPAMLRWHVVCLMPLAGRCALVLTMAILPYARPDGGLGTIFFDRPPRISALFAPALLGAVCVWAGGWTGAIVAVGTVILTLALAFYTFRKIGGATGDTLGATCEVVECVPALLFPLVSGFQADGIL